MNDHDEDWRLMGQERYLQGAALRWQAYRAYSEEWEHDHCEFCTAKFMDPGHSDEYRQHVSANPDVLTAGYTTTDEDPSGAEYRWICRACFDDFRERFCWRVINGPK